MEHAEEFPSPFGPTVSAFIGPDDKARVPIDITAANKQAPLLMNVKYQVQLPDHDFVIATKHNSPLAEDHHLALPPPPPQPKFLTFQHFKTC